MTETLGQRLVQLGLSAAQMIANFSAVLKEFTQ
jgi:hypothetical protein